MIRFSAVTKDFGGARPALEDVSFEVDKGEFVFLTGHSGSGKSTLLKIITKEYLPTSGEVEFDSVPLTKIRGSKIHTHRRKIGVVFQDYRLLPELNVWENIALPLEIMSRPRPEIEERVTDLLELVQLTDKAHNFPSQLSGGELQRVGIARALSTAPTVILADEPTGNLDPQTTLMIAKLFHRIHELGTTIFFATHDLSILATFAHRRMHLDKGRIVSDTGKPTSSTSAKASSVTPPPTKESEESPPPADSGNHPQPEKKKKKDKAAAPIPASVSSEPSPEASSKLSPDPESTSEAAQDAPQEIPAPSKTRPAKSRLGFPKISFPFSFGKKKSDTEKESSAADNDDRIINIPPDGIELVVQVESLDDIKEEPKEMIGTDLHP